MQNFENVTTTAERVNGNLGLILARGGSKGIPRKNARHLAGKPMIAWTIETALRTRVLDRVLVSTDDEEIRQIALAYGAEVPFTRPRELASDTALSVDAAVHAVNWLKDNGHGCSEFVVLLQPTSPLRADGDILAGLALQRKTQADGVVSVTEFTHPISWLRRIGLNGELLPWQHEVTADRRQDCEPIYQLNGAIYIVKTKVLLNEGTFFPPRSVGYVMPRERSLDVDTEWDFHVAELALKSKENVIAIP